MSANETPQSITTASGGDVPRRRGRPRSEVRLDMRFVIRMSHDLGKAIATEARRDGITAGAWARRQLLDRIGMTSPLDARSHNVLPMPSEDVKSISAAVRELASVNAAISLSDAPAAKAGLDRARALLIPVLMKQPRR